MCAVATASYGRGRELLEPTKNILEYLLFESNLPVTVEDPSSRELAVPYCYFAYFFEHKYSTFVISAKVLGYCATAVWLLACPRRSWRPVASFSEVAQFIGKTTAPL
jgi:hypothetical protein